MRFFLFFFVFFISNFILNANNIKISEVDNRFVVSENSILGFKIVNFLSEFAILDVNHDSLDFVNLFVSGYGYNSVNGDAKLPVIEELISVPTGANILYETTNLEERIISLNDYGINKLIAPSQPSLSKKNKSDYIPFIYNDDYYNFNGFPLYAILLTMLLVIDSKSVYWTLITNKSLRKIVIAFIIYTLGVTVSYLIAGNI